MVSGSEVVGAAMIAPVSAWVSNLRHERRALDHAAERSAVPDASRPTGPEGRRDVELALAFVAVHRVDVVVVVAQHHPALLALLGGEASGRGGLLDEPLERLGAREREDLVGAVGGEEPVPKQLEPRGPGPVLEARHEGHLHRHPATGATDLPVDLRVRAGRTAVLVDRHEVGQDDDPARGAERGLEDVGAREVPLGGGPLHRGPDRPGAAALLVQDGGEDATAVEPWEATPVDRAVQSDQRRGPHVTDQPVVTQGRGRRRPAIRRVGRRIELEVRHRPKYNADPEGTCMGSATRPPS